MAKRDRKQHGRAQPRQGRSPQDEPRDAAAGGADEAQRRAESGQPGGGAGRRDEGGGAGRRDEVGGSGVYPASAGNAPADAELRNQASWGQGQRGAAGYEDSGPSELYFYEAELEAAEQAEQAEQAGRGEERWGPTEHEGPGAAGLQAQPGEETIGGGTSGAEESPADERAAEQARRESEGRRGR